jgi:hypothetical protein
MRASPARGASSISDAGAFEKKILPSYWIVEINPASIVVQPAAPRWL